jgi:hypothetical protein
MQTKKQSLRVGICGILVSLLLACSGHGTFAQTFRDQDDTTRTLTLTSRTGFGVHPASNFPANLFFRIFGTDQLEGTYLLLKDDSRQTGKFVSGKTGEEQWIKFVSDDNQEWRGKIIGRALFGPDKTVWTFEGATADAKTTASLKIGE